MFGGGGGVYRFEILAFTLVFIVTVSCHDLVRVGFDLVMDRQGGV